VDALGNPIALALTPGQIHDLVPAPELLAQADPQAVIADKAFDADTFIDPLLSSGVVPGIPPRSSRKRVRSCDYALYRERNLVERFFHKLKHFRGIATRYDKLARTFLAGIQLAAATILLN
jgi:transposase